MIKNKIILSFFLGLYEIIKAVMFYAKQYHRKILNRGYLISPLAVGGILLVMMECLKFILIHNSSHTHTIYK